MMNHRVVNYCFCGNVHEPIRSHQNNENQTIYEGPPFQGLSEARRVGSFIEF